MHYGLEMALEQSCLYLLGADNDNEYVKHFYGTMTVYGIVHAVSAIEFYHASGILSFLIIYDLV